MMKSVKNKLKSDILSCFPKNKVPGWSRELTVPPSGIEIFLSIINKNQTNLRILNDEISKK